MGVIGNGTTIKGKGVCKALSIVLPTISMIADFLPLELENVDVILRLL